MLVDGRILQSRWDYNGKKYKEIYVKVDRLLVLPSRANIETEIRQEIADNLGDVPF